jgi:hypothetical protein
VGFLCRVSLQAAVLRLLLHLLLAHGQLVFCALADLSAGVGVLRVVGGFVPSALLTSASWARFCSVGLGLRFGAVLVALDALLDDLLLVHQAAGLDEHAVGDLHAHLAHGHGLLELAVFQGLACGTELTDDARTRPGSGR